LICAAAVYAQQDQTAGNGSTANSSAAAAVPRLIKFSGMLRDLTGKPLTGPVDVSFAIYKEQADLVPLWYEAQTLQLDEQGRYTVLLGAMQAEGLPMALFTSGEARWLEVAVAGAEPQPRTLLVSVPYALKAGDAAMLGGKPASAFVLAEQASTTAPSGVVAVATPSESKEAEADPHALTKPRAPAALTSGTANYIAKFIDATDLGNSVMYESLAGNVGLNTSSPQLTFDAYPFGGSGAGVFAFRGFSNTAGTAPAFVFYRARGTASSPAAAQAGDVLGGLLGRAYNGSGFPTGVSPRVSFYATENQTPTAQGNKIVFSTTPNGSATRQDRLTIDQSGYVGIGTAAPAATLDVVGNIQSSGGVTATSFSGDGTALTGVTSNELSCAGCVASSEVSFNYAASASKGGDAANALLLNGLLSSAFQPAGSYATLGANTFTNTQTISSGNLSLPATAGSSAGVINLGGTPFIHACCSASQWNNFVGSGAGNFTTTGYDNTGIGAYALGNNTEGNNNAASGWSALYSNTEGNNNAASGWSALYSNTTGYNNTASGWSALYKNTIGNYNVASGFRALYNNTANENTAVGSYALDSNTTGEGNTAVGLGALYYNCWGVAECTASNNTAVGFDAGNAITSGNANKAGSNNTFLGSHSGPGTSTALTNATAIGANAAVGQDNALVLGSINGVNGASASVNVGIGTSTPATPLHVASGDVYASQAGSGVIVKSPDGNTCARIGIDNSGALSVTSLTCP
jgi:hypothetical protein